MFALSDGRSLQAMDKATSASTDKRFAIEFAKKKCRYHSIG